MKKSLLATAAVGALCASSAVAAPLVAPPDVAVRTPGIAAEGGLGGVDEAASGTSDGGFLLADYKKKKHKHPYWYEGGEGGEGGPVIILRPVVVVPRPVVHYVPIIPTIIGGSISIVLEADMPYFAEFEPQIA